MDSRLVRSLKPAAEELPNHATEKMPTASPSQLTQTTAPNQMIESKI
jgi:hypothetical protein